MVDNVAMPHYSFSAEDGTRITASGATEDLADDQAAIEHAKLIARDLGFSLMAANKLCIVVRDEAGNEIGAIPLLANRR